MKPSAIQVAVDILRELGLEEQARWIEHPEAVRELLKHPPAVGTNGGMDLCVCAEFLDAPHLRNCTVVAAWRTLNDPRAVLDIERAHEKALRLNTMTLQDLAGERFLTLERTPAGRIAQVEALLADGRITAEMAMRALEYPTGVAGGIVTLPALSLDGAVRRSIAVGGLAIDSAALKAGRILNHLDRDDPDEGPDISWAR